MNSEYQGRRSKIAHSLATYGLSDPNPFVDLWQWYGKWSSGDLPNYQLRRQYIADLYRPVLDALQIGSVPGSKLFSEPTGWAKVDRQIDSAHRLLEAATVEEDFQSVGHRCREVIISLAQAVYDPARHQSPDNAAPSETDAKRMLDAYTAVNLASIVA
ncbi:MAG TPA: hypothetical protein VIU62_07660, partial [Chloroflexota bacterium]